MVATPTFTASASSSAIKASESPEICWRLSAQNQRASGFSAPRSPSANTRSRIAGSASAAPSMSAASTANPATSESPNHSKPAAMANTATAAAPCIFSQRCCACCQACGCAEASTGSRTALIRLAADAPSAPSTAMAMPASHHSPFSVRCPGIDAP